MPIHFWISSPFCGKIHILRNPSESQHSIEITDSSLQRSNSRMRPRDTHLTLRPTFDTLLAVPCTCACHELGLPWQVRFVRLGHKFKLKLERVCRTHGRSPKLHWQACQPRRRYILSKKSQRCCKHGHEVRTCPTNSESAERSSTKSVEVRTGCERALLLRKSK